MSLKFDTSPGSTLSYIFKVEKNVSSNTGAAQQHRHGGKVENVV